MTRLVVQSEKMSIFVVRQIGICAGYLVTEDAGENKTAFIDG